jgi:hypothetical protein
MCKCVAKVNKHLAANNTRLSEPFIFGKDMSVSTGLFITTEKVDRTKRGKPHSMLATFCPFCGVAYRKTQERL